MIFLETDRLLLRNVITDDVDIMFDYRNSETCSRYQRGQTKTYNGIGDLVQRRKEDKASMRLLIKLGYKDLGYIPSKESQAFGKWITEATELEFKQAGL